MRLLALALGLSAFVGCTSIQRARVTREVNEPPMMVEIIREHVPTGTSITNAKTFMEREGFDCQFVSNGKFGDRTGLDYLYCDRTEVGVMVSRRWQIAIVHRDDKVTEILANTGLIGP